MEFQEEYESCPQDSLEYYIPHFPHLLTIPGLTILGSGLQLSFQSTVRDGYPSYKASGLYPRTRAIASNSGLEGTALPVSYICNLNFEVRFSPNARQEFIRSTSSSWERFF